MSKQEFIDRLRLALSGKISAVEVAEHVNYYEDYINTQIRMGTSEEDVLSNLGDPRLIAKSILNASGAAEEDYRRDDADNFDKEYYRETETKGAFGNQALNFGLRMPRWLLALVVILIIVVILSVVFSVLSFLAPILIPILVVAFLVKLFRDWLN